MVTKEVEITVRPELCAGCLVCQMSCSFRYYNEFNPAKANIVIERTAEKGISYRVSYKDECMKCGTCAENCAFGALVIEKGE